MTDGPGQQPPQEPRRNADGTGEREVLEGRVIPSRTQAERDADPRRQFRRQSPPPQAPEAGPAWSAQADAASQSAPQAQVQGGQSWAAEPQQPALDPTPGHADPATQIIPAHSAQPQAPAEQQPYAGGPQAPVEQQQGYAGQQPYAGGPQAPVGQQQAPQGYAGQQQPHAGRPQPFTGAPQAPMEPQQRYAAQQQTPPQQPQAPAQPYAAQQQAQAPQAPVPAQAAPQQAAAPAAQPRTPERAAQAPAEGGAGRVPFGGGSGSRAGSRAEARRSGGGLGGGAAEPATPDWGALAEQQEATGARKRRVLMLVGGIVAVAVIAGGVATAVVMSGKSDDKAVAGPSSSATATASQQSLPPLPSFSSVAPPPPANPLDYLNTAAKDKAPLTPDSLFPGKQFVWQGRTYAKTRSDVTTSCAKNARKAVATALTANGCQKLIRATYTQGALAVTVGVAVFPDNAHAKKVGGVSQYLAPLNGAGVADFCHAVRCQMTANSVGRYAYFAISGFKNGTTLAANDTLGKQAANDASDFAFSRIVQRGKDAAAADPARQ
ncbi:hypothetical protein [Streptomyces sp. NPDC049040]|uniref:hypothetical protein n=1 Tax=Streptomyces sp. NPDC049040 TaxID=3365593 RepID=UPI0037180AB7